MVNVYLPKDYKPKVVDSILDFNYMIMIDNGCIYYCRNSEEVSALIRGYLGCRFVSISRIEHKKIYTTLRDFEDDEKEEFTKEEKKLFKFMDEYPQLYSLEDYMKQYRPEEYKKLMKEAENYLTNLEEKNNEIKKN